MSSVSRFQNVVQGSSSRQVARKTTAPRLQPPRGQPGVQRAIDSHAAPGVLGLHRQYGNRAIARLIAETGLASPSADPALPQSLAAPARPASRPLIQPKLTVGPAGDEFEREADRVAAQVTAPSGPQAAPSATAGQTGPAVQRSTGAASAAGFEAGGHFEQQLTRGSDGGRPLSPETRAYFEPKFGADFSRVRIHTNGHAAKLNRQIQAKAFTYGSDIHFGGGQFNATTTDGRQLLAHELTHVVQQGGAGSQADVSRKPDSLVQQIARKPLIQRVLYQDIVDQFQPGDLIYGLAMSRADTQIEVEEKLKGMNALGDQSAAAILDQLNNVFLGTETTNDSDVGGPDLRSPYGEKSYGYDPSPQVTTQAEEFKAWLEQHPKYGPELKTVRGKPLSDRARVWARIKAACKAGLEYVAGGGRGNIYFILDNLDMNAVVEKLRYDRSRGVDPDFKPKKKISSSTGDSIKDITPAELRFLHRHRYNAEMMDRVSFWEGGWQQPPPWATNYALWQKYKPRTERKPFPRKIKKFKKKLFGKL